MESVTAAFHSKHDMEQAAEVLRQQGAIDIMLDASGDLSTEMGQIPLENGVTTNASPNGNICAMRVVVESSRRNQALDTIARFEGHVT